MKNDILNRLSAVISALNNITVSGKQNLANLSGSISILEETRSIINSCNIETADTENTKNKG